MLWEQRVEQRRLSQELEWPVLTVEQLRHFCECVTTMVKIRGGYEGNRMNSARA